MNIKYVLDGEDAYFLFTLIGLMSPQYNVDIYMIKEKKVYTALIINLFQANYLLKFFLLINN